jgi:16S rRNA (cytosine967-C5)-methyltransferase
MPLVKAIFTALKLTFEKGEFADKAIEKVMRTNKNWNPKERSLVSETVYEIVRNWRLLAAVADVNNEMTDRNLWSVFGAWFLFKGKELPESNNLKNFDKRRADTRFEKFQKIRKLRESVPDWLDTLAENELGDKWDKVIHALNQKPSMVLRANTLKTNVADLQKILMEDDIETYTVDWAPDALELKYSYNVFRTPAFHQGLFEVQDSASQQVSALLNPSPGERVIDACAGAGGKTLHLAAIMKNKGKIIALDISPFKLAELKKRSARAGTNCIESRVIDTTKVIKRMKETADKLLLDVPCSGLGVLRRNPDAKWKLQPEEIERVKKQQQEILSSYSQMVKPGGKMVYATCSILPSEGEEQVKTFLEKSGAKWKLISEKRFSPEIFRCDGFYSALLEKEK